MSGNTCVFYAAVFTMNGIMLGLLMANHAPVQAIFGQLAAGAFATFCMFKAENAA